MSFFATLGSFALNTVASSIAKSGLDSIVDKFTGGDEDDSKFIGPPEPAFRMDSSGGFHINLAGMDASFGGISGSGARVPVTPGVPTGPSGPDFAKDLLLDQVNDELASFRSHAGVNDKILAKILANKEITAEDFL